jgi:DNA-binding MarR family transcriptional regulator
MSKRDRGRRKGAPFVMLEKDTLNSQDWKKLSRPEMIAYIYLKKNYNGSNSGEIPLKYVELKGVMTSATLSKALKGLIAKEWIEKTKHGGMFRYYCLYKLTGKYDRIR